MTNKKKVSISDEISRVIVRLSKMDPESEEYKNASANLETLCKARAIKGADSIPYETIFIEVAKILSLVLVLNYERLDVITTKAFGLLGRGRL